MQFTFSRHRRIKKIFRRDFAAGFFKKWKHFDKNKREIIRTFYPNNQKVFLICYQLWRKFDEEFFYLDNRTIKFAIFYELNNVQNLLTEIKKTCGNKFQGYSFCKNFFLEKKWHEFFKLLSWRKSSKTFTKCWYLIWTNVEIADQPNVFVVICLMILALSPNILDVKIVLNSLIPSSFFMKMLKMRNGITFATFYIIFFESAISPGRTLQTLVNRYNFQ